MNRVKGGFPLACPFGNRNGKGKD